MNIKTYSKTLAAAASAIGVVALAFGDGEISPGEWGQMIVACTAVYGVWKVRNAPETKAA